MSNNITWFIRMVITIIPLFEKTLFCFALSYRHGFQIDSHVGDEDLIGDRIPGQPVIGTRACENRLHLDVRKDVVVVVSVQSHLFVIVTNDLGSNGD